MVAFLLQNRPNVILIFGKEIVHHVFLARNLIALHHMKELDFLPPYIGT
jgi:hypothetical protein